MSRRQAPYANYITEDGILYVRVRDLPITSTGETNPWTNIDLAADGSVVAVKFVNAAVESVSLAGLPERDTVAHLAGLSLLIFGAAATQSNIRHMTDAFSVR